MKISKNVALAIALGGFALVALLEMQTSSRISLLLLHLLPILFVTWYVGPAWGVFLAVGTITVQIFSSIHGGINTPFSHYWYIDMVSDFIAALLLVWAQTLFKATFDRANRLARHDTLTNCLNRTGFYEALQGEIERSKRYREAFSLVYFDCDNFKHVNDSLGHHVGDALLATVGTVLHANARKVDAVSRLGGDEFAILLPQSGSEAAQQAIGHIKEQLDKAMREHGWPVSFSIGVASFIEPPAGVDEAIELADGLMYNVKKAGKNSIVFRAFP